MIATGIDVRSDPARAQKCSVCSCISLCALHTLTTIVMLFSTYTGPDHLGVNHVVTVSVTCVLQTSGMIEVSQSLPPPVPHECNRSVVYTGRRRKGK